MYFRSLINTIPLSPHPYPYSTPTTTPTPPQVVFIADIDALSLKTYRLQKTITSKCSTCVHIMSTDPTKRLAMYSIGVTVTRIYSRCNAGGDTIVFNNVISELSKYCNVILRMLRNMYTFTLIMDLLIYYIYRMWSYILRIMVLIIK